MSADGLNQNEFFDQLEKLDAEPVQAVAETTQVPTETVTKTELTDTTTLEKEMNIEEEKPQTTTEVETTVTETEPEEKVDYAKDAQKIIEEKMNFDTILEEKKEPVYEPEYLEYLENLKDPQIKAMIEARKQGKSILDLVKEIDAEDPSKLDRRQLWEKHLEESGLNEEEKEIELDKFDGMSPLEKANIVKPIKEELLKQYNDKLEQFVTSTKKQDEDYKAVIQKNGQEAVNQLESVLAQKEILGLELTQERKEAIRNHVLNNTMPDKSGNYDWKKTFNSFLHESYAEAIVKANIRKAETKAKVEVFKEFTRPSKETASTSASALLGKDDGDIYNDIVNIKSHDL